MTKLIKFWILKKARKAVCFDLCFEKKIMLRICIWKSQFEEKIRNERRNIMFLIVDNQVHDAMREVAIESENSFCTRRLRRMTGNSKLLLSAIYHHLRCKRGAKDEIPYFLIGLGDSIFFILSYVLRKKKFNMIQFIFEWEIL